ncbi:MAG: hypothetical protein V1781_01075 [Bacteroidota bacterium]
MNLTHKIFLSVVGCLLSVIFSSQAQVNVKDSSLFIPLIKFSYAFQLPGGNLEKRFGNNSNIGIDFSVKMKKNILIGAGWHYIFGNQIKENVLDSISTGSGFSNDGFIIDQNGGPAYIRIFERGFTASVFFGKIFPVAGSNPNSGIMIYGGPAFLQHKIKIDDIGHQSPQLTDNYKKGYDRLTNGFGLHEFLGYVCISNKRMINFYGGFEFYQTFTQSRRSFDFDLMKRDTDKRTDFLFGVRVGWILPLYKKVPQQYYYY